MAGLYISPEFEVIRNPNRCIACRVCERQCANEVHSLDPDTGMMRSDESKCVDCQRCVSLCPTHALHIVKNENSFRENANWKSDTIKEIYKQANSGAVLLSSMGNPNPVERIAGDKPLDRPAAGTNGNQSIPWKKAVGGIAQTGWDVGHDAAAAGRARNARDVLRNELRLHQLQRA